MEIDKLLSCQKFEMEMKMFNNLTIEDGELLIIVKGAKKGNALPLRI